MRCSKSLIAIPALDNQVHVLILKDNIGNIKNLVKNVIGNIFEKIQDERLYENRASLFLDVYDRDVFLLSLNCC